MLAAAIAGLCLTGAALPTVRSKLKVRTCCCYRYGDKYNKAVIALPEIVNMTYVEGVKEVNRAVKAYAKELRELFEEEMAEPEPGSGMPSGFYSFTTGWKVAADDEAWFTLKITTLQIAASGNTFYKFYNIDKKSGKYIPLSGLFKPGSNYIGIISEEIKRQMMERMESEDGAVYWIAGDKAFKAVKKDQNYYFDSRGRLVIVFDEHEVAPGSMGTPEFAIPKDLIKNIIVV
jgi:hypothetical protein